MTNTAMELGARCDVTASYPVDLRWLDLMCFVCGRNDTLYLDPSHLVCRVVQGISASGSVMLFCLFLLFYFFC